jgi:hypothetical protein
MKKHPLQFDDETTPIVKKKYNPFIVWCTMYLLLPFLSIVMIVLGWVERRIGKK